MNKEERLWLFKTELEYIQDKSVKEFAEEILVNADEYFFTVPASSSGKYHPDFARGEMGLVRHTKAVVYFLREILRSNLWNFTPRQQDLLIVAAISHDIKKQGNGGKAGYTVKEHPQLASDYVRFIFKNCNGVISEDECDFMCKAIESHMGVWGNPVPKTESEKILHIADLIASRKEIDLKFGQEELIMEHGDSGPKKETTPVVTESKSEEPEKKITVKNYVCTFGKHKGKKLEEIPEDYMQWAIDAGINQTEFIEMAKKYLKKKK